jgi:Amt family ammonium transporter
MNASNIPINIGNTGFMLLCASLVMLMTPGLAFFYGGLVGRRNVLTIMAQSFMSLAWTTVIWFAFGYSMCFGPTWHGIIGDPTYYAFMRHVTLESVYTGNDAGIPLTVHVAYQMMFAIITPALITGAFASRVTVKAYFLFLTAWLIFVYFPFVHMIWSPDGLLAHWGVRDFAGGIVVHCTAGFAALASVLYVGRRSTIEDQPHNVPLIALGTGLLWFGWYGFNAGSELRVDAVTSAAFLNTDVAASFAGSTWFFLEWAYERQPKFSSLLTGAVAGLATVTPAAGFVSLTASALIGILSCLLCYYAIQLKNRMGWDDALDVWGVHGIGGLFGTILLGVFASRAWNPHGADGLLMGNPDFLFKQVVAGVLSAVWALVFTYCMLWLIDYVTPVRVDPKTQRAGLDEELFGEKAYTQEL